MSEFGFIVEEIIKDRSKGGFADSLVSDLMSPSISSFRSEQDRPYLIVLL